MPKQNKTKALWEKEFDKKFFEEFGGMRCVSPIATMTNIKHFIKSLLNKQRARDREEVIKKLLKSKPRVVSGPREYKDGFNDCNEAWDTYLSSCLTLKSYKLKKK